LSDGSILIATRFGSTQQIHRVTAPGGDRAQITFQSEPVAGAVAIPGTTVSSSLATRAAMSGFSPTLSGSRASRCN
jgi:hypothetical protein